MSTVKASPIRASVLTAAQLLEIRSKTIEAPSEGELQVSVRSTGLCGSDLHYYRHFRNGDILVREPMSLGHESSGVVVAIGHGVEGFSVGDRVALEVGVPCGHCSRCSEGRYNICKSMRFRSSAKSFPHFQGTLQDRINHPAVWCHRLPEHVSLELGALLEPLSVAIHASRRAGLESGSTVLVFGAGAVGLLVAAVARIKGAKTVVIADIDHGRVQFATENKFADLGYTVPLKRSLNTDESLEIARENACAIGNLEHGGAAIGEVDVVFECTGMPSCVQAGIYAARAGGRLMLIGMGVPIQTLPLSTAALREVDILGVFRYANTYSEGIEMVSSTLSGMPDLAKLVTHRFRGLENAVSAFEMAGKTKDETGKLVLKVVIETGAD